MAYMGAAAIAAPRRASRRMRAVLTGTDRRRAGLDKVTILAMHGQGIGHAGGHAGVGVTAARWGRR